MLKLIFLFMGLSLACENEDHILDTSIGILVGSCKTVRYKTTTGSASKDIYQWLGVPYAEAPIGKNRFKSPIPFHKRHEPIVATRWSNSCMQLIDRRDYLPKSDSVFAPFDGFSMWRTDTKHSNMSEDCLYLNIFIPAEAYRRVNAHPIMVYFHGGSTVFGSSAMEVYNPETLVATKDTIVVTINYRLGVFGFLYLQDHFPGNQALQDQNLALKWVHENADKFGGDPSKITIFGQSAGAMLAGYHLIYNKSWPYFNSIILQSGSPLFQPLTPITKEDSNKRTIEFLTQSGCNFNNLVQCAQTNPNLPINSIDYYFKLSNSNYHTSLYLMTGFVPVLDGIILREIPYESFKNGRFKRCSLMIGFTKDEGTLFTAVTGLVPNFISYPDISYESFDTFVKNYFHYYPNYPKIATEETKSSILRHYGNESVSGKSYFREMSELLSEQMFICPGFMLADNVC